MDPFHDPMPPVANRYSIIRKLGSGGLGEVYECIDQETGRRVAVKRFKQNASIPEHFLERNEQEAATLASLRHPNIVSVYDLGYDTGGLFLVMELIQGDNLLTIVKKKPLPLRTFLSFAQQALEGLAAAHRKGILHLDIKPGNLMLNPLPGESYHVKLVDFGLARFVSQTRAPDSDDKPVVGSVYYISPEQLRRQPPTEASDLYSLGCVFYYALHGQPPFSGNDPHDVVDLHLNSDPVPIQSHRVDLPLDLAKWIHRLLAKDPEHRPASAPEVLHDLTRLTIHALANPTEPAPPRSDISPTKTAFWKKFKSN
jgi:serine/threonine protein kinase